MIGFQVQLRPLGLGISYPGERMRAPQKDKRIKRWKPICPYSLPTEAAYK